MIRDLLDSRLEGISEAILDELRDIAATPSVSSDPAHAADLGVSTLHVRDRFIATGLGTKILRTTTPKGIEDKPTAVARTKKVEGAPVVLLCAHHGVQPCGDVSRQSSGPFVAEVRGDRTYGCGTSNDSTGIAVHLGALHLPGDELPVNVVVFVEGEEELSSSSFMTFPQTYKEGLQADVTVVCDSDNRKAGESVVTSSLRDNSVVVADMTIADYTAHSGMFGGPMLDSITCALMFTALMYDKKGDPMIPGLDGALEVDVGRSGEEFRVAAGPLRGIELVGARDLAVRVWTEPSVFVIGFDMRLVSEASNTTVPHTCFKLSMRIVPDVGSREAIDHLVEFLEFHAPSGVKVGVIPNEFGPGYQVDIDSASTGFLHEALSEAWGVSPVNIGVGGSIPFISDFQRLSPDAKVVVTDIEDPLTNAHFEDESQCVSDLRAVISAEVMLLICLTFQ